MCKGVLVSESCFDSKRRLVSLGFVDEKKGKERGSGALKKLKGVQRSPWTLASSRIVTVYMCIKELFTSAQLNALGTLGA